MSNANGNGPQIKRREATIKLPEEYEGFEVTAWVNAPAKLWNNLTSNEETLAREAMSKLVISHNGWLDFEGQPYPPANTPAFWEEIPTELAATILVALQVEMQKLPNSIAPQNRRSKRG